VAEHIGASCESPRKRKYSCECGFRGPSWAGGGGGGRIAVYADDVTGFDIDQVQAQGGSSYGSDGGVGTVYLVEGRLAVESPISRQLKTDFPMTFDGPLDDVTLELHHAVANQSVEVWVGRHRVIFGVSGFFTNAAGESPCDAHSTSTLPDSTGRIRRG